MSAMEKRRLKIDLAELQEAFEFQSYDMQYYLDRKTGEVVLVSEEETSLLETFLEGVYCLFPQKGRFQGS